MILNQKLNIANVPEWQPLDLTSVAGAAAFGAMCLMVVCNAIQGRKWRVYELAFVFFAWYVALVHMRFLFMAAVLTTPFLAVDLRRAFNLGSDEKTIPAANAFMVTAAAVVFLFSSQRKETGHQAGHLLPPCRRWRPFNPRGAPSTPTMSAGVMTFQSKPAFSFAFDIFEHQGVLAAYLQVMYLVRPFGLFDLKSTTFWSPTPCRSPTC